MPKQFTAYNAAMPTTAAFAPVTTGTAVKTMLQIAPPTAVDLEVVDWGVDFDGATFGTKIKCELIETDVAATVTAHGATGIVKVTHPTASGSQVTLGTTATGFTATAEGTITASRLLSYRLVDQSSGYSYTWPLSNNGRVQGAKFLRVRVTATAAVAAVCFVTWQES